MSELVGTLVIGPEVKAAMQDVLEVCRAYITEISARSNNLAEVFSALNGEDLTKKLQEAGALKGLKKENFEELGTTIIDAVDNYVSGKVTSIVSRPTEAARALPLEPKELTDYVMSIISVFVNTQLATMEQIA